jgi:hypothetical protein
MDFDPACVILWSICLYGFLMYPLGLMLGSDCSPCCNSCGCEDGLLPQFITATFSGVSEGISTLSGSYLDVQFTSCFGGGATATVTGPIGTYPTDIGPIESASLVSKGGGYASLGRVSPTISVTGSTGQTGATFTPSFSKDEDACGRSIWGISSVSISGSTANYNANQFLVVTASSPTVIVDEPSLRLLKGNRTEPSVVGLLKYFEDDPGSGLSLSITQEEQGSSPEQYWSVDSVSVLGGGTGYNHLQQVYVEYEASAEGQSALLRLRTILEAPTIVASVSSAGGTGAQLSVSPVEFSNYYAADVTLTSGGSGYAEYDEIEITSSTGMVRAGSGYVQSVDPDGEITSIFIADAGEFVIDTNVVDSVDIVSPGQKFVPGSSSVEVLDGGIMFATDSSLSPYVASVTASIVQSKPTAKDDPVGSGASLTVKVDSDTASATFGQISSLTLDSGGDDYFWKELIPTLCNESRSNVSVLMTRTSGNVCTYRPCDGGCYGSFGDLAPFVPVSQTVNTEFYMEVQYRGAQTPPVVVVQPMRNSFNLNPAARAMCPQIYFADPEDAPFSCASLNFTATPESTGNGSVTVAASNAASCRDAADFGRGGCCSQGFGYGDADDGLLALTQEQCEAIDGIWKTDCCDFGCGLTRQPSCWDTSVIVEWSLSLNAGVAATYGFPSSSLSGTLLLYSGNPPEFYSAGSTIPSARGAVGALVADFCTIEFSLNYIANAVYPDNPSAFPTIAASGQKYELGETETPGVFAWFPNILEPLTLSGHPSLCPTGGFTHSQPVALEVGPGGRILESDVVGTLTITATLASE